MVHRAIYFNWIINLRFLVVRHWLPICWFISDLWFRILRNFLLSSVCVSWHDAYLLLSCSSAVFFSNFFEQNQWPTLYLNISSFNGINSTHVHGSPLALLFINRPFTYTFPSHMIIHLKFILATKQTTTIISRKFSKSEESMAYQYPQQPQAGSTGQGYHTQGDNPYSPTYVYYTYFFGIKSKIKSLETLNFVR